MGVMGKYGTEQLRKGRNGEERQRRKLLGTERLLGRRVVSSSASAVL